MYFVFTNGRHPFGAKLRRDANILDYRRTLHLEDLQDDTKSCLHLISLMTAKLPDNRPSADHIIKHYTLWTMQKQIKFLQSINTFLKIADDDKALLVSENLCNQYLQKLDAQKFKDKWMHLSPKTRNLEDVKETQPTNFSHELSTILRGVEESLNEEDILKNFHATYPFYMMSLLIASFHNFQTIADLSPFYCNGKEDSAKATVIYLDQIKNSTFTTDIETTESDTEHESDDTSIDSDEVNPFPASTNDPHPGMCSIPPESSSDENQKPFRGARRVIGKDIPVGHIVNVLGKSPVFSVMYNTWHDLAMALDTPASQINKMKQDLMLGKTDIINIFESILEYWVMRLSNKATADKLIEAFQRSRWNSIADEIMKYLARPPVILPSTKWQDLSEEDQDYVLSTEIYFTGKKTDLKRIFRNQNECIQSFMESNFHGHYIADYCSKTDYTLVDQLVPQSSPVYVSRRLTANAKLNTAIFNSNIDDVFVFSNIRRFQLTEMIRPNGTVTSGTQRLCITGRFIFLEKEMHFQDMMRICGVPIHLINFQSGSFIWVRSHGDIEQIQKHLQENTTSFTEEKLLERDSLSMSRTPVGISALPGMGKTVLLANLARHIQAQSTETIILYFSFTQVISNLVNTTLDAIKRTFASLATNKTFGQKVLLELLNNPSFVVELFLDGLDEVPTDKLDRATKILSLLRQLPNIRLFVTTRPHLKSKLETSLETICYNIQPLQVSEMVFVITQFWEQKGTKTDENVRRFAEDIVSIITNISAETDREVCMSPLYCGLLADTYNSDTRYLATRSKDVKPSKGNLSKGVFEIFDTLVSKKRSIMNSAASISAVISAHILSALHLYFPNICAENRNLNKKYENKINALELMVIQEDGSAKFVHRTIAEYFIGYYVACSLLNKLSQLEQEIIGSLENLIFNHVLETRKAKTNIILPGTTNDTFKIHHHEFCCPSLCYFIQGHLSKLGGQKNFPTTEISPIPATPEHLMACLYHDHLELFAELATCLRNRAYSSKKMANKLCYELLNVAARYSSFQLFMNCHKIMILTFTSDCHNPPPSNYNPLHLAVQRGNYSIVEYFHSYSPTQQQKHRKLLHFCVDGSREDTLPVVKEKLDIVKFLVDRGIYLNELDENDCAPIQMKNINLELLKCLVDLGADIKKLDQKGRTFAEHCRKYLSTHEFEELDQFLVSLGHIDFAIKGSSKLSLTSEIIGRGQSSIVFRGNFEKIPVAVKRIFSTRFAVEKELEVWKEICSSRTGSDNVSKLLDWTAKGDIVQLVMELASGNLHDEIKLSKTTNREQIIQFLNDIAKGCHWLHDNNIVHRDIKPVNILIFAASGNKTAKLGDFGISKKIVSLTTDVMTTEGGTDTWMAPEVLDALHGDSTLVIAKSTDIFALGMTFYFALSGGKHPFGWSDEHKKFVTLNIKQKHIQGSLLPGSEYTANNLLQWMMQKELIFRPTVGQVIEHPLFWSHQKIVDFFADIANTYSGKEENQLIFQLHLDKVYKIFYEHTFNKSFNWKNSVDELKYGKNFKYESYKPESVFKLIRLFRNVYVHTGEWEFIKDTNMDKTATTILKHFVDPFPDLLLCLNIFLGKMKCHMTDKLASYLRDRYAPETCHLDPKLYCWDNHMKQFINVCDKIIR